VVRTEGGTTSNPVTGYIRYRVIYDEQPPVAVCKDITVSLDPENPLFADGSVTITAADIDAGSTDNISIASMSLSQTTFTCDDVGTVPVTLTVLDVRGNEATCTANVTVVDNTPPFMLSMTNFIEMGHNTSVELTPQGPFDISDNCGSYTAVASTRTATCADIGTNVSVPIEVTDQYGNTATYNYIYQISKDTPPIVNTKPVTIYLGANGGATLTPEDIDDNSIDANGCYTTFTRTLSKTNFTCADAGTHTVTLTVNDGYNSASATATVTVVDSYDRSSGIIYVDEQAAGANNGTSWNDAYTDLQDALALSDNCGLTAIWVSQGTYKPGTSEYDSFVIPEGVTLLGGFTGNETSSGQRNWNIAPTILSGDINGNAVPDTGDSHTIMSVLQPNVTIDGVIVQYSYADDPSDNSQVAIGRTGGGLYINQSTSFTLSNTVLHDNVAFSDGSNGVGGALISFTGDTKLINCLLYNNNATTAGGAVSCESGEVEIINSTLDNNTSTMGGGIHLSDGALLVANSILSNNTGANGHINMVGGFGRMYNSLIYNGDVSGGVTQARNLTSAPEFEDTTQYDFRLKASSPGVNTGRNNFVVSLGAPESAVDLAGNERIYDYANGGTVDMGAYELQDMAPVAICQDITATLDSNGRVIISPAEINNGSYDQDSEITLALDVTEFDCSNLGINQVVLTVTADNGVSSQCIATVTVVDTMAPMPTSASLPDIVAECGVSELSPPSVMDNCSATVIISHDAILPMTQQGTKVVTWTYEDENGNTSFQTQNVIIEDTTPPELISEMDLDLTVYCNEVPEIPNLHFEDNCDLEVQVEYGQNETVSGEGYQIERYWTATDSKGNETHIEQNITVQPTQISVDENISVCTTETTLDLNEKIEGEAGNGIWESQSNGVGLNGSVIDPSVMGMGTYIFTYTEQAGMCANQVVVEISVKDDCDMDGELRIEVSKVLTPNEDGHNDYFVVGSSDTDTYGKKISLLVFDRWGQQVYKSDDYKNDWSATQGSNPLSSGTYFYVIQVLDAEIEPIKGSIYIGTK